MFRVLLKSLLIGLFSCALAAQTSQFQTADIETVLKARHFHVDSAVEQIQHRATHHIRFENVIEADGCSATAVGPHTLLTAGHCLIAANNLKIDEHSAGITNLVFDNNDHMLIVTDATFADYLPLNQDALKSLVEGVPVHMWGNPGHTVDLYRVGAFLKWDDFDSHTKVALFKIPIYPGDSGAGLINAAGTIIAVVSLGDQSAEAAVFTLQFTAAQLALII